MPRQLLSTILEGATLIDGTGASPITSAVVEIHDDRIKRIGKVGEFRYPSGASIRDLQGKWILPGFVEMHAHLPAAAYQQQVLCTYLAHGVTTLMNPAASRQTGIKPKWELSSGYLIGPRMFTAGRALNGSSFLNGQSWVVCMDTEAEIQAEVEQQATMGVDFIKVFAHLDPKLMSAAIKEAHLHELKVIGHLGRTSWKEAIDLGIDIIVHSALIGPTWELVPESERGLFREISIFPPTTGFDAFDASLYKIWCDLVDLYDSPFQSLMIALVENNVVVDPNLVVFETFIWGDDEKTQERLEPDVAPNHLARKWCGTSHPFTTTWDEEDFKQVKATWPLFLEMISLFHKNGVFLTAGSDLGTPWITPGVAFHRELHLLSESGISNLDVLSIATRNGAQALGIHSETGTIEEGKLADLVILSSDPIEDISNTRKIESVYMNGKMYDPVLLMNRN